MTQKLILRHGDCVAVLKGYEDGSTGAIVSDPPYGLEFMGKKWDRIGDVGKATGGFSKGAKAEKGVRGEIRSLPTYKPSGNVKCNNCGRWKIGHVPGDGGGGGLKCLCEKPDFPNVSLDYSLKMQDWHARWLTEAFRVLRPGGVIKAFSGTRTYHRMVAAMQEAGFTDLRLESWNYGSGFPKSHNVGKALDKANGDPLAWRTFANAYGAAVAASEYTHTDIDRHLGVKASSCYWQRGDSRGGLPPRRHWNKLRELLSLPEHFTDLYKSAEREVLVERTMTQGGGTSLMLSMGERRTVEANITAPATKAAQRWEGWGTALKPSWEPVVVGRKPG